MHCDFDTELLEINISTILFLEEATITKMYSVYTFDNVDNSGLPLSQTNLNYMCKCYLFSIQMSARLQSQPDWKARLHIAIDYLFATNQFTNRGELEMAAESFYKKLIIADKYKPDSVFSRPVLLITAASRHNNQDAIGADYGLGKVSIGVLALSLNIGAFGQEIPLFSENFPLFLRISH